MTVAPTTSFNNWFMQEAYVERLLDNAAYTSAHPDDTLVLAGPARYATVARDRSTESALARMLPIGMMQNFTVGQTRPFTPVETIGSGRKCFLAGKAQAQASFGRLFANGRNILRVLYHQAREAGIQSRDVQEKFSADRDGSSMQYFNLDSDLFLIPIGLAIVFRDKAQDSLGAFYMELCHIMSWGTGISSGSPAIMENVNIIFDRVVPIQVGGGRVFSDTFDDVNDFNFNPLAGESTGFGISI